MAIFYTDSGSFNDISVTGSSLFSGSVIISGSAQSVGGGFTGSFTGSHTGTFPYSGLTSVPSGIVSSSGQITTLLPAGTYSSSTQLPSGIVSSSGQVSYTGVSNIPNGIVSSSGQVATLLPANTISSSTQFKTITDPFTGSFTGSFAGTHTGTFPYSGLTGTPSGIVSSSGQVATLLPAGTYSSSTQLPAGIVSSSAQVTANLPIGTVSSSGQVSYTGLTNVPSSIVSSSAQFTSLTAPFTGSFTGSHFGSLTGTSSWANNVISASFATSASWAPGGTGGVTQVNTGLGLSGGPITSTGTITLDTSSAHFISGSQKVTSSRAVTASYADSFTGFINFPSGLVVTGSTILSGSTTLTGSLFLSASDTTATNRVLVLNTSTGQVFTTSSVGGGGGSGTVGPGTVNSIALFDTANTVSSSILTQLNNSIGINNQAPAAGLDIDAITAQDIIFGTSDFDGYVETNIQNTNAGTNASTDVVATSNAGNEIGGFIDMGINSSTYAIANNIGGPNDAYLYMTSSNGEMYIGNASTGANSNIKFFGGGLDGDLNTHMFISSSGRIGINVTASLGADLQVQGNISASSYTSSVAGSVGYFGTSSWATTSSLALNIPVGTILTASIGSGSLFNILEMSMAISGTIPAPSGGTASLDLNRTNYFVVSASGTGTVNWVVTNPPAVNRAQTFVVRYINGGAVTNTWFTNTRWPGGTAPTLTAGTNPDILGFITDDSGSNWRGVLLQRSSA